LALPASREKRGFSPWGMLSFHGLPAQTSLPASTERRTLHRHSPSLPRPTEIPASRFRSHARSCSRAVYTIRRSDYVALCPTNERRLLLRGQRTIPRRNLAPGLFRPPNPRRRRLPYATKIHRKQSPPKKLRRLSIYSSVLFESARRSPAPSYSSFLSDDLFQPDRSTTALVRSAQVSGANPVSRSTMVIHPSTGQTSEHKLHPTHSVSSTRGIRSSEVL